MQQVSNEFYLMCLFFCLLNWKKTVKFNSQTLFCPFCLSGPHDNSGIALKNLFCASPDTEGLEVRKPVSSDTPNINTQTHTRAHWFTSCRSHSLYAHTHYAISHMQSSTLCSTVPPTQTITHTHTLTLTAPQPSLNMKNFFHFDSAWLPLSAFCFSGTAVKF